MDDLSTAIKETIRDIKDFPKPGIVFRDITPLLHQPALCKRILDRLVDHYKNKRLDVVAGVESRGFLFGFSLALRLELPFVLIRKEGKLPYKKIAHTYDLEYGSATVEMHTDAIQKGQKVLLHDDLLATAGSALAAAELIEKCGGRVAGFNFLIELSELKGREKIRRISQEIESLAVY